MFVAALDLGITGCRTYIFDLAGTIIASDYQEWNSFYPSPSYVEQNANVWWNSLKITIERAIKKRGIDKTDIVSLSVTNQRETIEPVFMCIRYLFLHSEHLIKIPVGRFREGSARKPAMEPTILIPIKVPIPDNFSSLLIRASTAVPPTPPKKLPAITAGKTSASS